MSRKRVLIAGLGDSGLLTAMKLANDFDVTGISAKPALVSGQELGIRVSRPAFLNSRVGGLWYAPGLDEPERIVVSPSSDTLSCVAPRLATTGVLVLDDSTTVASHRPK